ncbi:acyl carrier protein [Anaerophilus nitritogenes]|uniref:acyl carrier protein n=1 Tax=Anaerophilus nitritogenes TaxID=2498136 RepID=UPI0013EA4204|nr:acyl carrier protein [Anaerophilus nitritogenes]
MNILKNVIKEIMDVMGLSPEEIQLSTHLYDELDVDSLDMSQILLALENQYKIDLPDEELDHIETVEDLVKVVEEKLKDKEY